MQAIHFLAIEDPFEFLKVLFLFKQHPILAIAFLVLLVAVQLFQVYNLTLHKLNLNQK